MYYYRAYSIYLEKCDPGGKGTRKNVTHCHGNSVYIFLFWE